MLQKLFKTNPIKGVVSWENDCDITLEKKINCKLDEEFMI